MPEWVGPAVSLFGAFLSFFASWRNWRRSDASAQQNDAISTAVGQFRTHATQLLATLQPFHRVELNLRTATRGSDAQQRIARVREVQANLTEAFLTLAAVLAVFSRASTIPGADWRTTAEDLWDDLLSQFEPLVSENATLDEIDGAVAAAASSATRLVTTIADRVHLTEREIIRQYRRGGQGTPTSRIG